MKITREIVAGKLFAYLRHEITLPELVDWAENAVMDGEFDEAFFPKIREAVGKIGLADVRAFGLTWEECEYLLNLLGYRLDIKLLAA